MARGMQELVTIYALYGLPLVFMGGETADLPDQIRSAVLDMDVFARMPKQFVIDGNVKVGDVIFGFQSDGQAVWEDCPNSGHMSNGSTMTRHVLMHQIYGHFFPHLFRAEKLPQGRYDPWEITDGLGMTVWQAMISPTRQWAIIAKMLIDELIDCDALHLLHAMVMNTGGGLTKCTNVGTGITFVQDIPKPPPIFRLIQSESGVDWREMVKNYNCGIGFTVIGSNESGILQLAVETVSVQSAVRHYLLGECESSPDGKNRVVIRTPYGTFENPNG